MRFLHTADLHIGQQLHGYDRSAEHEAMLAALAEAAAANLVDAVVICGDVFDNGRPSSASARIFARGMAGLRQACPDASIVVLAGNHDSGAMLESHSDIYRGLDIRLVGNLDLRHPESHVIDIHAKGVVVALPYTYSRNIPDGFNEQVLSMAREMVGPCSLPLVVAAHTTVLGCDATGHPAPAMGRFDVGNIDGIDLSSFGSGFDYLALGHIHRPQFVGGNHRVRYSGSPLPVSFDERFAHSFSLVEISGRGEDPVITQVPFDTPRPVLNIPSHGFGEWNDVIRSFSELDPDFPGYVRLNVVVDGFLPSEARDEAEKISAGKSCRFCLVNSRRREVVSSEGDHLSMSVSEFREMSVMDIAAMYADGIGTTFDEKLLAEVISQVQSGQ